MNSATLPLGKCTITALLPACAVALALDRAFYDSSLISPYFAFTLASTLMLHLRVRPVLPDAVFVLLGASLIAAVDFLGLHYPPQLMAPFAFLGLSSLAVLAIRTVWARPTDRKLLLYALVPAILFAFSDWMASTLLALTGKAHPQTLDLYLFSFDASLHVQLSFLLGRAFLRWQWLKIASLVAYIALAVPVFLVYAGQLARKKEKALPVMFAFLITGPLGMVFYNLFPALGPAHIFHRAFPLHPFSTAQAAALIPAPIAASGVPNCMPSLHMAWVLLAWWNSEGLSRTARSIALAFVVFTVFATLGTGEHYFIDLVVAFPFALIIHALCVSKLSLQRGVRRITLLFGALAMFVWLALLRFGYAVFWASPAIPWTLIVSTIGMTVWLRHRLLVEGGDPSPAIAALTLPI